ncbi:MAG: hydantoinase/oxoprolinase family protein, partial [Gammaproteobacteria bacterium]
LVKGPVQGLQAFPERARELKYGLQHLDGALNEAHARLPKGTASHAVTMTGELSDIFPDRELGVRTLISRFLSHHSANDVCFYAGSQGLVGAHAGAQHSLAIASANWHAAATFTATRCADGMLIDIGSTTTDILVLRHNKVHHQGYSDAERLQSGELLYTGVVRTPVMAVARGAPFCGEWQAMTAEHFASMADVHVLTRSLREYPEWAETADKSGRCSSDCARRLARMLGRDIAEGELPRWRALAKHLAGVQTHAIRCSLERVLSRHDIPDTDPLIGAGVGRFIVRELARQLDRRYVDFSELMDGSDSLREMAAVCAPATALAYLLKGTSIHSECPPSQGREDIGQTP